MINSNEELKVGSCVSWLNSHGWSYGKIQSEYELRKFTKQVLGTFEWIFGIHPSLLPDGFCLSKIEDSETQHSLSIENVSLRTELEAARKEILRLSNLINEHNNLCLTCQELGDHFDSDTWVIKAAPKPEEG